MEAAYDREGYSGEVALVTSSRASARDKDIRLARAEGTHAPPVLGVKGVACNTAQEQSRLRDELLFWHTMSQLGPIRNPSQQCDDLQKAFIGSYWSSDMTQSCSQYITVYHWMAPRSPVLDKARETLCLLHLGTRHGDMRLLMEARARHCEALQRLRLDIQRPGAVNDDSILGACFIVAQCEVS